MGGGGYAASRGRGAGEEGCQPSTPGEGGRREAEGGGAGGQEAGAPKEGDCEHADAGEGGRQGQ